jgi:hypothetical protein
MIKNKKLDRLLKSKIEVKRLLKYLYTAIAIIIMVLLYKRGIVAPLFVNGEAVTFGEIVKVISKDDGSYLDQLIAEKVIQFEANKRNIEVQKEEVEQEMLRIEREALDNGITLIQLLKEKDSSIAELEKNTKTRLMLYKILSEDVEITEWEIDNYIRENNEFLKEGEEEVIRDEVIRILLDEKVSEMYETWIREAKAESEVNYLINY